MTSAGRAQAPDRNRAKVYAAEDQFSSLMNRGGKVEFFGSVLDVPTQKRFANLESIDIYISGLFAKLDGDLLPPRTRERKGSTKAHYEFDTGVIAIPVAGQAAMWALRETLLLHECAHHVAGSCAPVDEPAHGPTFTACMLMLVETTLGDQARLLLSAGYLELGVPVGDHQEIFSHPSAT